MKQVRLEGADLRDGLFPPTWRPSTPRVRPCRQFREGEGLQKRGVGARLEALDTIVDAAERGEEQDRRVLAGRAGRPNDRWSIETRQHAVDDETVIVPRYGKFETVRPERGMVEVMTFLAQSAV